MFKIINSKPKEICVAYRCKNKKVGTNRFCSKHNHRYQKHKNPMNHTFHILRSHATERGIKFSLSMEEFKDFCQETGYMDTKGKSRLSSSIDRKDPLIGYTRNNIQILELGANTSKMHEDNKNNEAPF